MWQATRSCARSMLERVPMVSGRWTTPHAEPPRSLTACSSRGLAGRGSRDASPLSPVQACAGRLGAVGSSPRGAAAPAARRSRFRGPGLVGESPSTAATVGLLQTVIAIIFVAACAHPAWATGKNNAQKASQNAPQPAEAPCKPVYLTLDTGHMAVAPLMADVLNKHKVKVTFFAANERTQTGDGSLGT